MIICLTDHIVHGVMQSIVRGIKIIDIHVAYVLARVIDIVVSHVKGLFLLNGVKFKTILQIAL